MSIAMTIILGLLLAGVVVPVALLLTPESLRGDWIAAVGVAVGLALAFVVRRRRATH